MATINAVGNGLTGTTGSGDFVGSNYPAMILPTANAFSNGYQTTVTAGGTTVLTNNSAYFQYFTGSTTQTVTLPDATTLTKGFSFEFVASPTTGQITINSLSGGQVYALQQRTKQLITCIDNTINTAAAWDGTTSNVTFAAMILNSLDFATTTGIIGTTTNDSAVAGSVGEYISARAASVSPIGTATATNITSISLTAGDWDVRGSCYFSNSSSTTLNAVGISTTSATFSTNAELTAEIVGSDSSNQCINAPIQRISIASTTTVYLVGEITYTSGGPTMTGQINARRIR